MTRYLKKHGVEIHVSNLITVPIVSGSGRESVGKLDELSMSPDRKQTQISKMTEDQVKDGDEENPDENLQND